MDKPQHTGPLKVKANQYGSKVSEFEICAFAFNDSCLTN
jgi:hypothetical protein